MERKKTIKVMAGGVAIGGGAAITVQSMTNTDTRDAEATVSQIKRLVSAGCEIIRVAVPDMEAARALYKIKECVNIPLVADIHFNYRLALEAAAAGADKIRINPGNIGDSGRVKAVVNACRSRNIPIRIGVNSGSVERELLAKYNGPTVDAMVESALNHAKLLEACDFYDTVISVKASGVAQTIESYIKLSEKCDYPLHLGLTHSGTYHCGSIKSAAAIGGLLSLGIGDTIRVSLTDEPEEEVKLGKEILEACGFRKCVSVISCPTCGRCRVNVIETAKKMEKLLSGLQKPITVAVMGCAVNGPGEAREADIGIAGGDNCWLLFKKGEIVGKIHESDPCEILYREVMTL